ncbi:CrcB family protein [Staphylococcus equorum]|uniref:Fluoride-specific ion channel FluC n=1 Tax=Staphylococcus equorum TaxID=246432 RepID=A0A9X4R2Z6_9STAP|nr:CrcB family protein [Staphylococcus equorum]MDG0844132.1 CrcB family protein [Staphylococcus equorum]MDG0860444.1 CrcB family protein [Staphylococcus equorum]
MTQLLLVMLGGGLGAVIRGFVTNVCARSFDSKLPIATPIVNILGSLIIGLLMGMTLNIYWIHPFVIVGVLGGLTTFSTLSSELVNLLTSEKNIFNFLIYSSLQYGVAFLACLLGYIII